MNTSTSTQASNVYKTQSISSALERFLFARQIYFPLIYDCLSCTESNLFNARGVSQQRQQQQEQQQQECTCVLHCIVRVYGMCIYVDN